jgi:hypothetical protein
MRLWIMTVSASALLIGSVVGASAQEGTAIRSILGAIGFIEPDRDPIDYRARAPLVVPPSAKLPAPKQGIAASNPQWPNDPNVAARRAERADALLPATEREKYNSDKRLSQEELRKGQISASGSQQPAPLPYANNTYSQQIEPIIIGRQLAAERNAKDESASSLGAPPERKYLHEPPTALRRPAGGQRLPNEREAPVPTGKDNGSPLEFARSEGARR